MSRLEIVGCSGARDVAGVGVDSERLRDAEWLEVRLDRFAEPSAVDLRALRTRIAQRAIFTLRPASEGGEYDGDLASRERLHRAAEAAGFDALDLEADLAARLPRGTARRIVSWHGDATGSDVSNRVRELTALGADVVKVAGRAVDPAEALRFVTTATSGRAAPRPGVVAIAMGESGKWLRPLAGRFDMPLLYAAIHPSRKTADGQITVDAALGLYRARSVSAATRVFGVVGADVRASFSPRVHNAVFAALGLDAIYVDISHSEFEPLATVAHDFPFAGLSVTQPHKAAAAEFASSFDAITTATGAANTLLRGARGFAASNTDVPGFRAAIELALRDPEICRALSIGHGRDALSALSFAPAFPARRRIEHALVYGTGGAARAVAFALREMGARVCVTGRDQAAAMGVALAVGGVEAISEGRAHSLTFDLLVKCVPDRADGELALDPLDFAPGGFAADVVYRPLETGFLRVARAAGRTPVPGLLMFAGQAALQAAVFCERSVAETLPLIATALAAD